MSDSFAHADLPEYAMKEETLQEGNDTEIYDPDGMELDTETAVRTTSPNYGPSSELFRDPDYLESPKLITPTTNRITTSSSRRSYRITKPSLTTLREIKQSQDITSRHGNATKAPKKKFAISHNQYLHSALTQLTRLRAAERLQKPNNKLAAPPSVPNTPFTNSDVLLQAQPRRKATLKYLNKMVSLVQDANLLLEQNFEDFTHPVARQPQQVVCDYTLPTDPMEELKDKYAESLMFDEGGVVSRMPMHGRVELFKWNAFDEIGTPFTNVRIPNIFFEADQFPSGDFIPTEQWVREPMSNIRSQVMRAPSQGELLVFRYDADNNHWRFVSVAKKQI